jgi:PD-(D/E)XK nuclease superfamily protein
MGQLVYGDVTSHIIGAAFEVHNTLGYGFLEKVYQRTSRDACQFRSRARSIQKNDPIIRVPSVPSVAQCVPLRHLRIDS